MTNEGKAEIRKLEEMLKELISRAVDMWESGEGDLMLEVRDDGGSKRAKLKGGFTKRIK